MNGIENMDLNLYKTFLVVAKSGSISKAAEKLCVSQPAVSYSIKMLENSLGCKMFFRNAKGIELTAEAQKLLFYVESAYNTILTGYKMLNDSTDLLSGDIRIGVPTHIGTFLLSKFIQKFSEQYPGIKFHIVNKSTNEMVDMLERRLLDIVVDSYPISSERADVTIKELMEIDNCLVGNEKYKDLANKKKVKVYDLRKYPLLLPTIGTSTRYALEEKVKNSVNGLDPLIEVPTTEVMLDLVKKGMGIGYFAKPSVLNDINNNKLYQIDVDIQLPKTTLCMAYVEDFLTTAPKKFAQMLQEEINNILQKNNKEIRILLTQNCIYSCSFCHKEGLYDIRKSILNCDNIEYIYDMINKAIGTNKVHITGGEPLIREDIIPILTMLKEKGANLVLTTNGYYIDEKIELGNFLDKINISLHILDKEKYEKMTQYKGSYEKVISNIKILRAKYPTLNIVINMTLYKSLNDNMIEIEKMIKFAFSVKADLKIVELYPITSNNFIDIDTLIPQIEKLGYKFVGATFRKRIYSNTKQNIILTKCTCSIISKMKNKKMVCKMNNDIYITPDGKISMCREKNNEIDLSEDIMKKNNENMIQKIELACEVMGNACE